MINIIVCGADGRMGRSIINIAKADPEIKITGAVEIDSSPAVGTGNPVITKISDLEKIVNPGDILVDFTVASNTINVLKTAVKKNAKMVIGTTGLSDVQKEEIAKASKTIPVVFSPNMSVGINILIDLVEELAKKIPNYEVEVVEFHHNKKKDAPSGTAVRLAEAVAKGLGRNLKEQAVYGRRGLGPERTKEEIGIHAVRCGDIVGDHTVYFAGLGERIEITHRAHSRENLASGAVKACRWLENQKPGLYDMRDVLGLK